MLSAIASKMLELVIGWLRLEGDKYVEGTEEFDTFHDAADALDDALELLEALEQT